MGVDTDKIRSLREKLGMTLKQAAAKAGLSNRQHWHQLESGEKPNLTVATLEKVAKALCVKAMDLLK